MKHFKKLVGEKVYLSPMNMEDIEEQTEWLNDLEVTDGLGISALLYTYKNEKEKFEKRQNDIYNFAIIKIEDDTLIGCCSLYEIDQIRRKGKVGIYIGKKENRSSGYGTESLGLLIEYCFKYINLHNIMLNVFDFNTPGIKCYTKVGFKEFGRRRECYFMNGKYYNELFMDILSTEFNGCYIKNGSKLFPSYDIELNFTN